MGQEGWDGMGQDGTGRDGIRWDGMGKVKEFRLQDL